jgi:hypothetical protein
MRLAHLSPDLGTIDFCYRLPGSSTFDGLVLGSPLDAGVPPGPPDGSTPADAETAETSANDASPPPNGGSGALAFPGLTSYVVLKGWGTIDIALVATGGQSCASPIATGHVTLDAGKRATVAVMGLARVDASSDQALSIAAFTDDSTRARRACASFTPPLPAPSLRRRSP